MNDEELRHWQEVETHLSDLTKHSGWGALIEYANYEMMRVRKERVLSGGLDHETYLRETGWFKGIHDLIGAPAVVTERVSYELDRRRELIDVTTE